MYIVKSIGVGDTMRLLRKGEFRVALQIGHVLTRHAVKTAPTRVRHGARRVLLRAAARLS